jgi:hypothetical protein
LSGHRTGLCAILEINLNPDADREASRYKLPTPTATTVRACS